MSEELQVEDFLEEGFKFHIKNDPLVFEVVEVLDRLQRRVRLQWTNPSGRVEETTWAVNTHNIVRAVPPTPHLAVIQKIKQMEERRTKLGYRW